MRYSFQATQLAARRHQGRPDLFRSANAKEVHREHYARRSLRDAAVFSPRAEVVDVFVIK